MPSTDSGCAVRAESVNAVQLNVANSGPILESDPELQRSLSEYSYYLSDYGSENFRYR